MKYERDTWMGTEVPRKYRNDWTTKASHHWRTGVLDALKAISREHDISAMVEREAAIERIDRARRARHVS